MVRELSAMELRDALRDGNESALLDVREGVHFGREHINLARHLPLSLLELEIGALVPRRTTRIVLCDDEHLQTRESPAGRAAAVLQRLGYTDIAVLRGGIPAWKAAGLVTVKGYNTLVKAFADCAREHFGTPSISADALEQRLRRGQPTTVVDVRTGPEYASGTIPGACNYPGFGLALRMIDDAERGDSLVAMSCLSRTRGVLGTTTLRLLKPAANVAWVEDGIMSWVLKGYPQPAQVEAAAGLPPADGADLAAMAESLVARFELKTIGRTELEAFARDPSRSTYIFDVRPQPGNQGSRSSIVRRLPGGQVVMKFENLVGVRNSRVVLIDDEHRLGAAITAFWLIQLGETEVFIYNDAVPFDQSETIAGEPATDAAAIATESLLDLHENRQVVIVDVGPSADYIAGHLPGAFFINGAALDRLRSLPPDGRTLVFTSPDGAAARIAARDVPDDMAKSPRWLRGGTTAWRSRKLPLDTGWNEAQLLTPFLDDWGSTTRVPDERRNDAYAESLIAERELASQVLRDDMVKFALFAIE